MPSFTFVSWKIPRSMLAWDTSLNTDSNPPLQPLRILYVLKLIGTAPLVRLPVLRHILYQRSPFCPRHPLSSPFTPASPSAVPVPVPQPPAFPSLFLPPFSPLFYYVPFTLARGTPYCPNHRESSVM